MLSDLVERYVRGVRMDEVMTYLTHLTEHDRYQASLGIERAADMIASAARAIGLAEVSVERCAADGTTKWWTFRAARAWTPTTAKLDIRAAGRSIVAADHATQPFTIATYSAPTPHDGLIARIVSVRDALDDAARGGLARIASGRADLDGAMTPRITSGRGELAGAVVVIGPADFSPELVTALADRGALGFITDAPSRAEQPGRIEFDLATPLFGFSVTAAQRQAIEAAGAAEAHVRIAIDRSACMPVVTGVLPGRGPGEVWLTSHLCHPRPGANDNASGAAALLGVARALVDRARTFDRSIRFVWGPEFLGVAALLHQRTALSGRDARPMAVINLDMVGEDPAQCGVPLVVERAPDWCPSLIAPLAEHVVEQVFAHTSTHAGTWSPGPFLGFSDHALFANFVDPDWRSPAVQLWHPGDPFNHSAADTLDKVSVIEMQRATAAGAVLAEVLACDGAAMTDIVQRWCEREEAVAGATADRYRDVDAGTWSRRLVEHVREQSAVMRELVDARAGVGAAPATRRGSAPAFRGRWPGPFNYRGVLADLSASRRSEVVALFGADKRNYAVLTYLAMLADRFQTRDEVIEAASLALRAPIAADTGMTLWSALFESGWLEEPPPARKESDDGR